jgi:hypothetical protein
MHKAELGRNPLMIQILKRAGKFYNHLKGSDSQIFHNKAITYREMNLEKKSLSKLVQGQMTTPYHCQTFPKTLQQAGLSNQPGPGILGGY